MRLVDSDLVDFGRLELWNNSKWMPVCDDGFDDVDAAVVCQYLGYITGKSVCCSALGQLHSTEDIKITQMNCNGGESSPHECAKQFTSCSSGRYASVYCMTSASAEGTL